MTFRFTIVEHIIEMLDNSQWEVCEYSVDTKVDVEIKSTVNVLSEIPSQKPVLVTNCPNMHLTQTDTCMAACKEVSFK